MDSDLAPLDSLAERINAEHAACESALRAGLAHAIAAGQLLIEARARVGHGGWLPWVRDHCRFSDRSARGYMQVARHFDALPESERQRVADLPLRDALAMLATPKAIEGPTAGPTGDDGRDARLAEAAARIKARGANLIEMGRQVQDVREDLGPEQFPAWLEAEFPDEGPALARLADVAAGPNPDPCEAVAVYHDTLAECSDPATKSGPLSPAESKRLEELEAELMAAMKRTVAQARALEDVRDNRLYREGYATFEEFCLKELSLDLEDVKELIDEAAQCSKSLTHYESQQRKKRN